MEIWKGNLWLYNDRIKDRMEAAKQAYVVVLGQCSQPVRDRLTASEAWQGIQVDTDLMGLLRLIRQCLYTGATTKKDAVSLQEAEEALFHFKQGEHMSNHEYLEKFRDIVKWVEHHGGEPGCQDSRVNPILQWTAMDPTTPTTDEINKARVRVRNEYLGILFIRKSDPKRYGQLVAELQNNHTCGADQYPQTLTRGYELLVNYHSPRPGGRIDRQDGGVSFLNNQDDEQSNRSSDHGGGRHGRGRGQGRGSGRGRGG